MICQHKQVKPIRWLHSRSFSDQRVVSFLLYTYFYYKANQNRWLLINLFNYNTKRTPCSPAFSFNSVNASSLKISSQPT
jgi:hypothetical protein